MEALAAVFVFSLFADLLGCEWQAARERGQLGRIAVLSAVIEAMSWAPIFVAVFTRDLWLVSAGVLGAVAGGVWGAARERKRQSGELRICTQRGYERTYNGTNPQMETKHRHSPTTDGAFIPNGKNDFSDREVTPTAFAISKYEIREQYCAVLPPGWSCLLDDGHVGPCAAVPVREELS